MPTQMATAYGLAPQRREEEEEYEEGDDQAVPPRHIVHSGTILVKHGWVDEEDEADGTTAAVWALSSAAHAPRPSADSEENGPENAASGPGEALSAPKNAGSGHGEEDSEIYEIARGACLSSRGLSSHGSSSS